MKNVSTFSDDASALPPGSGPARTVRSLGGFGRRLLGGAALAALLATGSVAAKADESNAELAAEIHALKAQLYHLENRVEKQRVQIHAVQVKANTYQANAAAPYEPPVPWDKKFHLNASPSPPAASSPWKVFTVRMTRVAISARFRQHPEQHQYPAHSNEIRGTARQSRFSLLVQGNYDPDTLISGYGEFDFLGAGVTANSTESNSYQPRVRHLYATIDWAGEGLHLLAGQTWSLITMNQKGITPRNEDIPADDRCAIRRWLRLVADAAIAPRQELRRQLLARRVGRTAADLARLAQAPTPVSIPRFPPTAVGATMATCSQVTSGGSGVLNSTNKYSLNHIPDFVLKAAYEGNFDGHAVHIEGFGLYTDLYDYATVGTPATGIVGAHNDTTGWGCWAAALPSPPSALGRCAGFCHDWPRYRAATVLRSFRLRRSTRTARSTLCRNS